ncbi:MAG: hypothetical protein K0R34_1744, partial [Herbinix sp.]|nr:hypothetical protein [Herbinix sp.]
YNREAEGIEVVSRSHTEAYTTERPKASRL